jgi:hypothetical protein
MAENGAFSGALSSTWIFNDGGRYLCRISEVSGALEATPDLVMGEALEHLRGQETA